mgnify:CR=1 FL=1
MRASGPIDNFSPMPYANEEAWPRGRELFRACRRQGRRAALHRAVVKAHQGAGRQALPDLVVGQRHKAPILFPTTIIEVFDDFHFAGEVRRVEAPRCHRVARLGNALFRTIREFEQSITRAIRDQPKANEILDTLIKLDYDMKMVPGLATSWERTSPNVWTFTLREGVTFHDGTPLDAEAVRNSLERVVALLPYAADLLGIARVEAKGPFEVEIETREPFAALPNQLTDAFTVIYAPSSFNEAGEFVKPVGTGPWRLVDYLKQDRTIVERFEDYWGETPALERIEYRYIPDHNARAIALEAGLAEGGWCPIEPETFRSAKAENVYVVGDATIAADMPKSAFSANSQARAVAGHILADLAGAEPPGLVQGGHHHVAQEEVDGRPEGEEPLHAPEPRQRGQDSHGEDPEEEGVGVEHEDEVLRVVDGVPDVEELEESGEDREEEEEEGSGEEDPDFFFGYHGPGTD